MSEHKLNLDEMMNSPHAKQLLKDRHTLMQLANSPDTKKLMQLLNETGGSELQSAAKAALDGNPAELIKLMDQVMHQPEGMKAVEGISRNIPQK